MAVTRFCLFFVILFIVGCSERQSLAPVFEASGAKYSRFAQRHRVVRGDTLYSIAFRYDQDYRQLAVINHLPSPYLLRVGQVIYLRPQAYRKQYMPKNKARTIRSIPVKPAKSFVFVQPKSQTKGWQWPVAGRVVMSFAPERGQKGVTIAGKRGDKIRAAANGIVAYAGNGLAGYGNLIIIKHNNQYLTAYGNNSKNLVHEGQFVKAGQNIAEMGMVDHQFWGVHFEIRKLGRPVNPLNYVKVQRP